MGEQEPNFLSFNLFQHIYVYAFLIFNFVNPTGIVIMPISFTYNVVFAPGNVSLEDTVTQMQ